MSQYFGLISALEHTGVDISIAYFDFVRSILQLQQYEPFVDEDRDWETPKEVFARKVKDKANEILPSLKLSSTEVASYVWNNLGSNTWERLYNAGRALFSSSYRGELQERLNNNQVGEVTEELPRLEIEGTDRIERPILVTPNSLSRANGSQCSELLNRLAR